MNRWRTPLLILAGLTVAFALAWWVHPSPSPRVAALLDLAGPEPAFDAAVLLAEVPALTDADVQLLLKAAEGRWRPPGGRDDGMAADQAQAILAMLGARPHLAAAALAALAKRRDEIGRRSQQTLSVLEFPASDPAKADAWFKALPDGNQSLHLPSQVLVSSPTPPPGLLPIFVSGLRDERWSERLRAARALAEYGRAAGAAAPRLRLLLNDPDRRVRPAAALALGSVAPEFAGEALSAMALQIRTNVGWTGDLPYQLCARLGSAAAGTAPGLEADLENPRTAAYHGSIAAALWRIRGTATPNMVAALASDVDHGWSLSRRKSLETLGEIGPAASNAAPAVVRATRSRWLLIRQLATNALEAVQPRR